MNRRPRTRITTEARTAQARATADRILKACEQIADRDGLAIDDVVRAAMHEQRRESTVQQA